MISKAVMFAPTDRPALTPVANRPIAAHNASALADAGIRTMVVACSPREVGSLHAAMEDACPEELELSWLVSEEHADVGATLRKAEHFLDREPFVVHLGDSLCRESLSPMIQAGDRGPNDATALVQPRSSDTSRVVSLGPDPLAGAEPAGV